MVNQRRRFGVEDNGKLWELDRRSACPVGWRREWRERTGIVDMWGLCSSSQLLHISYASLGNVFPVLTSSLSLIRHLCFWGTFARWWPHVAHDLGVCVWQTRGGWHISSGDGEGHGIYDEGILLGIDLEPLAPKYPQYSSTCPFNPSASLDCYSPFFLSHGVKQNLNSYLLPPIDK